MHVYEVVLEPAVETALAQLPSDVRDRAVERLEEISRGASRLPTVASGDRPPSATHFTFELDRHLFVYLVNHDLRQVVLRWVYVVSRLHTEAAADPAR